MDSADLLFVYVNQVKTLMDSINHFRDTHKRYNSDETLSLMLLDKKLVDQLSSLEHSLRKFEANIEE